MEERRAARLRDAQGKAEELFDRIESRGLTRSDLLKIKLRNDVASAFRSVRHTSTSGPALRRASCSALPADGAKVTHFCSMRFRRGV